MASKKHKSIYLSLKTIKMLRLKEINVSQAYTHCVLMYRNDGSANKMLLTHFVTNTIRYIACVKKG
jgi:hypothetical protein